MLKTCSRKCIIWTSDNFLAYIDNVHDKRVYIYIGSEIAEKSCKIEFFKKCAHIYKYIQFYILTYNRLHIAYIT